MFAFRGADRCDGTHFPMEQAVSGEIAWRRACRWRRSGASVPDQHIRQHASGTGWRKSWAPCRSGRTCTLLRRHRRHGSSPRSGRRRSSGSPERIGRRAKRTVSRSGRGQVRRCGTAADGSETAGVPGAQALLTGQTSVERDGRRSRSTDRPRSREPSGLRQVVAVAEGEQRSGGRRDAGGRREQRADARRATTLTIDRGWRPCRGRMDHVWHWRRFSTAPGPSEASWPARQR